MRIAVARRRRDGQRVPGVTYFDVTTFGHEAETCAQRLSQGSRIGLSGRLDANQYRGASGRWETAFGVLIDQLDFL